MESAALIVIAFVAFYPLVTAALCVAGGLLFGVVEEDSSVEEPAGGWPGVTLLIPAFNEELTIATAVQAALAAEYPQLELLVLDDGSTDATSEATSAAANADPRLEVVRDPVNKGKADQLNAGFARARHELVAVADADTHLHPLALKLLVNRMLLSERTAAVAGGPHVTNREHFLSAMQVLEVASIVGLIRRTQAISARVGTVAGVLGLFRRKAVLGVGGYDGRMATEDIDLTWRLLLAGWDTRYEPAALVGMQVPTTVSALWAQRKRWARGQGEVLHTHARDVVRWRNRWLWPLLIESCGSLVWVLLLGASLILTVVTLAIGDEVAVLDLSIAWGVTLSVIAVLQLSFALGIDLANDRLAPRAFLLGPIYPLAFWLFSAAAAFRAETVGLQRGPAERHVTWDIARERV